MSAERHVLPLADYEGLPIGTLQHRIRSLDQDEMHELIGYEQSHGRRAGVLEILENRLKQLEEGAEPSGGTQDRHPETPPAPSAGSPVSSDTAAPQSSPPPHGVPAQPGRPKGDAQP